VFRTKDRNVSTELYYILSSNKKGAAFDGAVNRVLTTESSREHFDFEKDKGTGRLMGASKTVVGGFGARAPSSYNLTAGSVQECMKLLSDKLVERFKKLNLAYRFFDLKSSGKLTFNDFTYGIEQLGGLKFTRTQISDLFKRVDVDGDGMLSYLDFCELCEERIREIDPFDSIV